MHKVYSHIKVCKNSIRFFKNPNFANPNFTNPNFTNPNFTNPNFANPNFANPNLTNPNFANPNSEYSQNNICTLYKNKLHSKVKSNLRFPILRFCHKYDTIIYRSDKKLLEVRYF